MAMSFHFTCKDGTVWWHTALYCGYCLSVGPVRCSVQTGSKRHEERQHWHEACPSFCFIKYESSKVKQQVLTEEIVLKEPQIHTQNSLASFFWVYFLLKSRGCPTSCNRRMTCDSPWWCRSDTPPPPFAWCWSHPRDPQANCGARWMQPELLTAAVFTSALRQLSTRLRAWRRAHSRSFRRTCKLVRANPTDTQTFSVTSTRLWSGDPRKHKPHQGDTLTVFITKIMYVPAQEKKRH